MKNVSEYLANNTLYQRVVSPTPPFWRKVRNISGVLGVLCLVASKIPVVPDPWRQFLYDASTHLFTLTGASQFTTNNKSLSDKKFLNLKK